MATRSKKLSKARIVPSQGPLLKVKMMPKNWTVRTSAHNTRTAKIVIGDADLPGVTSGLASRTRLTVASIAETEMGISMVAAANTALPSVDVTLALPPPVSSTMSRKS
jgi:hypothetical protein